MNEPSPPIPPPPALDGPWRYLGREAFDAFCRLTAEAIVAELADSIDISAPSVTVPVGTRTVGRPPTPPQRQIQAEPNGGRPPRGKTRPPRRAQRDGLPPSATLPVSAGADTARGRP